MKIYTICLLIWDIGVPLIWLQSWLRDRREARTQKTEPVSSMFFDADWIANIKL